MAFKHRISFATNLDANFRCDRFRITPYIVSKLLRAAIRSRYAVQFDGESEQTPFLGKVVDTDLLLCTGFGTCGFVPIYFCSETNE